MADRSLAIGLDLPTNKVGRHLSSADADRQNFFLQPPLPFQVTHNAGREFRS